MTRRRLSDLPRDWMVVSLGRLATLPQSEDAA